MSAALDTPQPVALTWPNWVADSLQTGLVVLNSQGQIHLFNRWMVERSGLAFAEVAGRHVLDVFPELAAGRIGLALTTCLTSGFPALLSNSLHPTPFPLFGDAPLRAQGVRLQQTVRMMRSPGTGEGEFQVLIEIVDVSGAVRRERLLQEQAVKLRALSSIDPLTGLANRRTLDETLDREFRRASRGKLRMAAVMIDIDLFKPFNDSYGHQAGDRCLVDVAIAMQGILNRPTDLLARFGGEEFVAVLPDTDLPGAVAVGRKLRAAVQALAIPHGQSRHGVVTISQGVASTTPILPDSFASLIAQADVALYAAKRAGRNRVAALPGGAEVDPEIASTPEMY